MRRGRRGEGGVRARPARAERNLRFPTGTHDWASFFRALRTSQVARNNLPSSFVAVLLRRGGGRGGGGVHGGV